MGRRGRKSVREKIEEHFNMSVWDFFKKEFSDVQNADQAVKRLVKLSKGAVTSTPITIIKTIERGKEDGELTDEFFLSWLAQPTTASGKKKGRRGRKPITEIVEEHFNKPFLEVIKEKYTDGDKAKEIADKIARDTDNKVSFSGAALHNNLKKMVDAGEIKPNDPLAKVVKVRRKRKTPEQKAKEKTTGTSSGETVLIHTVCQNCGDEVDTPMEVFERIPSPPVLAQRCSKCGMWSSKIATFTYAEIEARFGATEWVEAPKSRFPNGGYYTNASYLDENNNPIESPFRSKKASKKEAVTA